MNAHLRERGNQPIRGILSNPERPDSRLRAEDTAGNYQIKARGALLAEAPILAKGALATGGDRNANSAPTNFSVNPQSGSGSGQVFSFTYNDPNGGSDILFAEAIFNVSPTGENACFIHFDALTNQLLLRNNDNTGWLGPLPAGSATSIQNGQCALSGTGSGRLALAGTSLSFTANLTFLSGFPNGVKNIYLVAADTGLTVSGGFISAGTFTVTNTVPVNQPPTVTNFTFPGTTTNPLSFSVQFNDPTGVTDIEYIQVLFNNTNTPANGCYINYRLSNGLLYLADDAGIFPGTGVPVGSNTVLQNSQCVLYPAGTQVSVSGTTLTVVPSVGFKTGFSGVKNVYIGAIDLAANVANLSSTVTITPTGGPPPSQAPQFAGAVFPASGNSLPLTFSFSDANGVGDIQFVEANINATSSAAGGCYLNYRATSLGQGFYLRTDDGLNWAGPVAAGSAGTIQNSQCSLNLAAATAIANGTTLTVSVPITFASTFAGIKTVYLGATDASNLTGSYTTQFTVTTQPGGPGNQSPTVAASGLPVTGNPLNVSVTATDANGASDIQFIDVLINGSFSTVNGCYVSFRPSNNNFYLRDDAGATYLGSVLAGSNQTIGNAQCTINGQSSSVTVSGNSITISPNLSFTAGFTGTKGVYLGVADAANASGAATSSLIITAPNSTGNQGPVFSSASYTPATSTFSFAFSDPNGASDLQYVEANINTAPTASNGCYINYRPGSGIYLRDNAGNYLGPLAVGSNQTLSNSQCTLNAASTTVAQSGNTLTVNANVTFSASFQGNKNVYLAAVDLSNVATSSQATISAITTPGGGTGTSAPPTGVSITYDPSTQSFLPIYGDPDGAADLRFTELLITAGATATTANACYVQVDLSAATGTTPAVARLRNDEDTAWLGPVTLGRVEAVQNSQCTLGGINGSVTASGTNLSERVTILVKPAFAGSRNVFLRATDAGNSTSTWLKVLSNYALP